MEGNRKSRHVKQDGLRSDPHRSQHNACGCFTLRNYGDEISRKRGLIIHVYRASVLGMLNILRKFWIVSNILWKTWKHAVLIFLCFPTSVIILDK
jgi:hypothetical protein